MTNKNLIFLVFGLVIGGSLIFTPLNRKYVEVYKIQRDTVRTVDTVVVVKDSIIEHTKTIYQPEIVYVDSTGNNIYQDTSFIEQDFYIWYQAAINGTLNQITLNYRDTRPIKEKYILDTRTITEKQYIKPSGFYVGASISNTLTPSVLYLRDKNIYGIGYSLDGSFQLSYFRKIY